MGQALRHNHGQFHGQVEHEWTLPVYLCSELLGECVWESPRGGGGSSEDM